MRHADGEAGRAPRARHAHEVPVAQRVGRAIESGRLAAQTLIDARGRNTVDDLQPYSATLSRLHPRVSATPLPLRAASAAIGRVLLGSPAFTRHVVLDRWFLRA